LNSPQVFQNSDAIPLFLLADRFLGFVFCTGTLLKSDRRPLAALKKCSENPGNLSTTKKKGMNIQKETANTPPVLKRFM
jgi:hypothetical protein